MTSDATAALLVENSLGILILSNATAALPIF